MTTPLEAKLIHDQIIAQSLADPAFRQRLKDDPRAVFADMHLNIPDAYEVVVVEDTAMRKHMVLPEMPVEGPLSDDELEQVAGGVDNVAATGHFGFTR